jgi:acetyl-CoA carboxylase biotin carboxyl carrier protein
MKNGGHHGGDGGLPKDSVSGSGSEDREHALPLDEVSRLVDLVRESGVGEISVRQGDLEVTVRAAQVGSAAPSETAARHAHTHAATPEPSRAEPETGAEAGDENGDRRGLHEVLSPLVGTFYRAPAPGEDDYVQVGDKVREGQTLCIVEAMKLMNEIPADVSGEVVEVLADNAGGVQYDQPLFALQPDSE